MVIGLVMVRRLLHSTSVKPTEPDSVCADLTALYTHRSPFGSLCAQGASRADSRRTHHLHFFYYIRLDGNTLHSKLPAQSILRSPSRTDEPLCDNFESGVDPRCDAAERDRGLQFAPRCDTSVISARQRRFGHEMRTRDQIGPDDVRVGSSSSSAPVNTHCERRRLVARCQCHAARTIVAPRRDRRRANTRL